MIRVTDLWKTFGTRDVLKGISLEIPTGTTYVILGGSGSGKTVLMKHVIGLLKPDRGTVLVDDVEIPKLEGKALTEARRMFGMVFQQAALFDSMTVFENVAFPLKERKRNISTAELKERVIEKLRVVDLSESVLPLYPAALSGGMKKRVALARALIHDPQVVLYDEPTTGLDPITTDQVDEMILEAKHKLGVTSIVISHDIASAFKIADEIIFVFDGEIVCRGLKGAMLASEHPFVQRFFATWKEKNV